MKKNYLNKENNILTVKQVATTLNCSISKIYELIKSKQIEYIKTSGYKISQSALNEYLARRTVKADPFINLELQKQNNRITTTNFNDVSSSNSKKAYEDALKI